MSTLTNTAVRNRASIKTQTLFGLCAAAAAVVLPQLFHSLGNTFGLGSGLGEALLPMHLPVMLVGFTVGPVAGALAGLISPLASFALSAMPSATILPFMVIELLSYGLFAGLMSNGKLPRVGKVLSVQVVGRLIRAAAIALAVYGFGYTLSVSIIWTSVVTGLWGIALQLAVVPLVMGATDSRE